MFVNVFKQKTYYAYPMIEIPMRNNKKSKVEYIIEHRYPNVKKRRQCTIEKNKKKRMELMESVLT